MPTSELSTESAALSKRFPYTPEVADRIIQMLENGIGLIEISRTPGLPSHATIARWTEDQENCPGFGLRYARARTRYLSHLAEEIITISDDATNDYMDRQSATGSVKVVNAEHVNRSRLRVDSRKWLLSKLRPEIYGEHAEVKVDVTSGGLSCAEILRQRVERRRKGELPAPAVDMAGVIDVAVSAATNALARPTHEESAEADDNAAD